MTEKILKGKVVKGIQLARVLDFPTINATNDSYTDYGVYIVSHVLFGDGVALVMPSYIEIHFFKNIPHFSEEKIEVKIVRKIPQPANGIMHYFYEGLKGCKKHYNFIEVFEKYHEQIYNDYLSVKDKLSPWPEKHLYNYGWEVYGMFINESYQKLTAPLLDKKYEISSNECMFTKKLIQEYIPNHGTAGFSVLGPGTELKPHTGVPSNYLRMHLGLKIPKGNLGLKSESHGLQIWEKGKAFYFDDRLMHEAWNKTNEERVILLVDFEAGMM
jgi:ornithine lipid ester-linked acyl 2-hydroxylase